VFSSICRELNGVTGEACRLASSGIDSIGVRGADLLPLGEGSDENLMNFARLKIAVLESELRQSTCSFVGFSQGLSASQPCFSLTPNQHQSSLSA